MRPCSIYSILNTVNNKCYVGSSVNSNARLNKHFCDLRKGVHYNKKLQNAFDKYGEWAFERVILADCVVSNRDVIETLWIEKMDAVDRGYNICRNGMSLLGTPQSAQHVARRIAAKNGYRHSEETRDKIAKSKASFSADHLHTPEIRAKVGAKLRGTHLSAEHKALLSLAAKNRKPRSAESLLKSSNAMKLARLNTPSWGTRKK